MKIKMNKLKYQLMFYIKVLIKKKFRKILLKFEFKNFLDLNNTLKLIQNNYLISLIKMKL